MRRAYIGVVLLALLSTNVSSQQAQLDSLRGLLARHPAKDAERVRLLLGIVRRSETVDPFKAEQWADEAVATARGLEDRTLTARALIARVGLHQAQYGLLDDSAAIEEAFTLDPSFGGDRERAFALRIKDTNELNAGRADPQRPLLNEALRLARKAGDRNGEAHCLVKMAFALLGTDRPKADSCIQQAIELMVEHGTKGELAQAILSEADMLNFDGESKRALELFDLASRTAVEGGALFWHALAESNKGYVYWDLGNYPMAMDRMVTALGQFEAIGYQDGICVNENNIGCLYREMGDKQSALEHFQRSYEIALRINVPDRIIAGLNDIGLLELDQGEARSALVKFTEALRRCPEVEGAFGAQALSSRLTECHRNIGRARAALGDLPGAIHAFEESERIAEQGGQLFEATLTRCRHAEALLASDPSRPEVAIQLYSRVANDAEESGWLNLNRDALQGLSDAYERLGDRTEALRYLKEFLVVKDSLLSSDKARAISNLQIQYETEKKEQQIVLLGKEKEVQQQEIEKQKLVRNGFMGGFALVALFAGVFFFQRNRISKEKKRSEELLLNILPEEVADELKAKGEADAKQIDQVTVLFTDFKGFTAMSEQLSPKELVRDIHECFSAFDHVMAKHGIEKIKTIGDAYMAAGGLPTPNTTHALDVVKAALEIRDFIAEGKAHKMAAGLPYFEIRIGVHTGPVVAGIVGVKKFAYDIWGDTVNIASRMESSGEVGQVNISEATYALVKDEPGLTFTPRGKVQAKGKGEMEMYFVGRKP